MTEQLVSRLVPISSGAGIARCEACLANGILVCSAIGDRDVARLERAARTLDVPAGVAFIHEGDAARSFYNLCGGTVRLFKALPDGRRQIVGFARPGYFLGIAPSGTYAFSAETIELCRLCRFSRTDLMSLLDDIPTLERRIFEHTAHELTIARDQILLLGRKTAKERLATFLLAWSTETQPCGHPVLRLRLPMPRSDIADYLGLTVETVSRTFTALSRERLIALASSTEIVLLDAGRLMRIANGIDATAI